MYAAAIRACEKGKQWQFALGLFAECELERTLLGSNVYNAAISACEKCSEWERAILLFSKLGVQRLRYDIITYNASSRSFIEGFQGNSPGNSTANQTIAIVKIEFGNDK